MNRRKFLILSAAGAISVTLLPSSMPRRVVYLCGPNGEVYPNDWLRPTVAPKSEMYSWDVMRSCAITGVLVEGSGRILDFESARHVMPGDTFNLTLKAA